jgi:hypothetical protein
MLLLMMMFDSYTARALFLLAAIAADLSFFAKLVLQKISRKEEHTNTNSWKQAVSVGNRHIRICSHDLIEMAWRLR